MTPSEQIKLAVLEELLDDIKEMYPEYIADHIKEKISIIKHGI